MVETEDKLEFSSHFLGPKGENEEILKGVIDRIVSDYVAWRRNYQNDDRRIERGEDSDAAERKIKSALEMLLARLHGSFPIYSPRYIGHQLSEITIESVAGALAGVLYNANNVTPEAGIVTVELEIDACNALSSMLGYRAAPDPPAHPSGDTAYEDQLKTDFSWCHLTSGGTVANIEALWVARTIKYFPLAVKEVCDNHEIDMEVELANGHKKPIGSVGEWDILGLKPSCSISLLADFVRALKNQRSLSIEDASAEAWKELNKSSYAPARGLWSAYSKFPPCILVSGAAHYSISKAADLLGIGRSSIRLVKMDSNFRMNMEDLKRQVLKAFHERQAIVAVICMAGTTEEGAVDPAHRVFDLRRDIEKSANHSFWVHIDAAWGGFIKTLFVDSRAGLSEFVSALRRLAPLLAERPISVTLTADPENAREWTDQLVAEVRRRKRPGKGATVQRRSTRELVEEWFERAARGDGYGVVMEGLRPFVARLSPELSEQFEIRAEDRLKVVRDFTAGTMTVDYVAGERPFAMRWPAEGQDDVGLAFLAFGKADSITVDPHKLGYQPYPSGAVAFRNDRTRHFIQQEAPYVTSTKTNALLHYPIRHAEKRKGKMEGRPTSTRAFAPFTLEGSRPSGPACSLWLASKTIPFDREHHGAIIRSSLLSARYLYELIDKWQWIKGELGEDIHYRLVHFNPTPPDTNIVVFGVMPTTHRDIDDFNEINLRVYEKFSISRERGQTNLYNSQSFFLSKTDFQIDHYPYDTLKRFLSKECRFRECQQKYIDQGLVVLRATVMNPHILPAYESGTSDFVLGFMKELDKKAQEVCMTYVPRESGSTPR